METKTLKQKIKFNAKPKEIYGLLLNTKKHKAFTGTGAKISTRVGGKFSAYDEYITGKNINLVPYKKIVQSWHAKDWPAETISTVSYELKSQNGKTVLNFTHSDIPLKEYKEIRDGWYEFYWDKMKEYIKNNPAKKQ